MGVLLNKQWHKSLVYSCPLTIFPLEEPFMQLINYFYSFTFVFLIVLWVFYKNTCLDDIHYIWTGRALDFLWWSRISFPCLRSVRSWLKMAFWAGQVNFTFVVEEWAEELDLWCRALLGIFHTDLSSISLLGQQIKRLN